ncbi:RAB6A-GEF complex partner protein 2 isoform X3 [Stegostoma tigrinum]|uniref:RAB6A-GEF complex partner protein 2 isoform X3 n=1 Tax=Stegostoma tigrinum TaxID=3053191 RepID=UPI00202B35D7|nr:RAB6A-GEF complex partner protein 2 isoform X3 [Stegostoma tigrinum]
MIEVVAKLLRGPVFLTGEVMECVITFTNPMTARSTSASSEMLAWASAQIHCQFHTSESRVALPPSEDTKHDVQAENETVFVPNRGERGKCILATPPKILFCDLRLDPGESKSWLEDYQFPPDDAVAPTNPFLDEDENVKKDTRLVDLATEMLMTSTSRRSLHLYNITNVRGKVGKFCIFKTIYKIGEDVVGTFDFSEGDIPCLQFSVSLQTEEHVQEEYQRKPGQPVSLSTHARHQESCLHTAKTHFSLPIPLSATPSFMTAVVTLKWRLHFEFVTAREPVEPPTVLENQSEIITWTGTGKIDVDTFSWDLSMKVLPTNPVLASYVSQFASSNSISI